MGSREVQFDGGHLGEVCHMQILLGSVISRGGVNVVQVTFGIEELCYTAQ